MPLAHVSASPLPFGTGAIAKMGIYTTSSEAGTYDRVHVLYRPYHTRTEHVMREMDRLVSMLFPKDGQGLVNLKFFPGEQPVTVEEFCEEVHSAFLQIESGQVSPLAAYRENVSQVHVDKFLADA